MTTLELISALAPVIALSLLVLGILCLLFAFRAFSKSRTRSFWRQRRAAGQQGLRLFIAGILLITGAPIAAGFAILKPSSGIQTPAPETTVTAIALINTATIEGFVASPTLESPSETPFPMPVIPSETPTETPIPLFTATFLPSQSPTLPPTATLTLSALPEVTNTIATPNSLTAIPATSTTQPSATPSFTASYTLPPSRTFTPTASSTPTATVSFTPTPTVTITYTPTQTATPTDTLIPVSVLNAPTLESSITPPAGARLTIYALDTQVSSEGAPVTPSIEFKVGFTRIYYFVSSEKMLKGSLWRRELWRDDSLLQANEYLWVHNEGGNSYYFFGLSEGFQPGVYQIRLYIGRNSSIPAVTAAFRVKQ